MQKCHTDTIEVDGQKYIYDFNLLDVQRTENARANIEIYYEIKDLPPATRDQMQLAAQSNAMVNFWKNIFIPLGENGEPDFEAGVSDEVLKMRGKDLRDRREVCKNDFLSNMDIIDKDVAKPLIDMFKGAGSKDGILEVLKMAKELNEEPNSASTKPGNSSTTSQSGKGGRTPTQAASTSSGTSQTTTPKRKSGSESSGSGS